MGVMKTTSPVQIKPLDGLAGRVTARIRMVMAAKRRTVTDLAQVLHLSERQAQRLHKGHLAYSFGQVETVAKWLDVDEMTLLAGQGLEAVAA